MLVDRGPAHGGGRACVSPAKSVRMLALQTHSLPQAMRTNMSCWTRCSAGRVSSNNLRRITDVAGAPRTAHPTGAVLDAGRGVDTMLQSQTLQHTLEKM